MRKRISFIHTAKSLFFLAFGLFWVSTNAFCQTLDIIPKPQSVKLSYNTDKVFVFSEETRIVCAKSAPQYSIAQYLQQELEYINTAIEPIMDKSAWEKQKTPGVILFVPTSDKVLGKEGYEIDIKEDKIILMANENAGFFYACQTLIQILNTDMSIPKNKCKASNCRLQYNLPLGQIRDWPRFAYRGKHLDCARHFFSVDEIKTYIDMLAFHKINTFHWHLTDDQGWRIEIKRYPLLQQKAAYRDETLIGHYTDTFPQQFDHIPYGGYYTQEQVKEIIQYAKERYITIIPEIEMPGHARALLCAYPELSCTGKQNPTATTWGVFEDVLCTKEETFTFLENVLDEVCALFPSQFIHIGGDECPKIRWKECPVCQQRIKDNGLKDEKELQSYFMNRIEQYLEKKGKRVIGWDEVLEGGAKGNITVMSWQGEAGGIAAAKSGHDAIMTPSGFLYFDYYQGPSYQEPLAIGGYTHLKKVYMYEPLPKELTPAEAKHIIGVQACTWTEYIGSFSKLQYTDLPRLAAFSEIAWSAPQKDYNDFLRRIEAQLRRYDYMSFNYATSHYAVQGITKYNKASNQVELTLSSVMPNNEIHYTINGQEPSRQSPIYTTPIVLSTNSTVRAVAMRKDTLNFKNHTSPIYKEHFTLNKATGKTYTIQNVNPQYPGNNKYTLTDGLFGTKQGWDNWVGTLGNDYDVTVDLESQTDISSVAIDFLDAPASWIFAPINVNASLSLDGKTYYSAQTINTYELKACQGIYTYFFLFDKRTTQARYIKIHANAIKTCPKGHSGYGYAAHCFADEISVE